MSYLQKIVAVFLKKKRASVLVNRPPNSLLTALNSVLGYLNIILVLRENTALKANQNAELLMAI
jgi:hypothetical protein